MLLATLVLGAAATGLALARRRFGRLELAGAVCLGIWLFVGGALLSHMQTEGRDTHLVRYEDLIREPVPTLEPLLEFLGLDPADAPAMVGRADVSVGGMDHHMTAPSASASIGRWRSDLEPELAERCDAILSPVIADFGYATAEGEPSAAA